VHSALQDYVGPYLNINDGLFAHIVLGITAHHAQAEAVRIEERSKGGVVGGAG